MFTRDDVLAYRCAKSCDWPDIDLYMDQVISLLESRVSLFYTDTSKPVTPTMINNYVKQKIVPPSLNKKYSRLHLERLYVIFLLKPALSLADIYGLLAVLNRRPDESFGALSHEIETALASAFSSNPDVHACKNPENTPLKTAAQAFAYTLLNRLTLSEYSG